MTHVARGSVVARAASVITHHLAAVIARRGVLEWPTLSMAKRRPDGPPSDARSVLLVNQPPGMLACRLANFCRGGVRRGVFCIAADCCRALASVSSFVGSVGLRKLRGAGQCACLAAGLAIMALVLVCTVLGNVTPLSAFNHRSAEGLARMACWQQHVEHWQWERLSEWECTSRLGRPGASAVSLAAIDLSSHWMLLAGWLALVLDGLDLVPPGASLPGQWGCVRAVSGM
jgi:hypothetical protein